MKIVIDIPNDAYSRIKRLVSLDYFEEWKNKIPADVYIDDRNIFCKNIDWKKIREELINMKSNR